jgi:hypothetical protein
MGSDMMSNVLVGSDSVNAKSTHHQVLFPATHLYRVYRAHRPARRLIPHVSQFSSSEPLAQETPQQARLT